MGYRDLHIETPKTGKDVFWYETPGMDRERRHMIAFPQAAIIGYREFLNRDSINNFEANVFAGGRRYAPDAGVGEALRVMEIEYPGLIQYLTEAKANIEDLIDKRIELIKTLRDSGAKREEILKNEGIVCINARVAALREVADPAFYTAYKYVQAYVRSHSVLV